MPLTGFMNGKKYLEQLIYEVADDFNVDGVPASWAKGQPCAWGDEGASIRLDKVDSSDRDLKAAALSLDESLLAVSVGNDIHVYHVDTRERRSVLRGHVQPVISLGFSSLRISSSNSNGTAAEPDGYLLVSSMTNTPPSRSKPGEHPGDGPAIVLWELDSEGRVPEDDTMMDVDAVAEAAGQMVREILTNHHGWSDEEVEEGDLLQALKLRLHIMNTKHRVISNTCLNGEKPRFAPDGRTLIYLTNNQTTQHGMRDQELLPRIVIWDFSSKKIIAELKGHTDSIMWTDFSADCNLLGSVAWDQTGKIWDTQTGSLMHTFGPTGGQNWRGIFSPDSKHFLLSGGHPTKVTIYKTDTGELVSELDGFSNWVRAIAWNPDGKTIALGQRGTKVSVFDAFTKEKLLDWELKLQESMMQRFGEIHEVAWLDGGRKLMFKLGVDGTVEIWDKFQNIKWRLARPREVPYTGHLYARLKLLNEKGFVVSVDMDSTVRFWDLGFKP